MTCFSRHQNQKPLINGEMKLAQKKKISFSDTVYQKTYLCYIIEQDRLFSKSSVVIWHLKTETIFFHNLLVFFLWLTNLIFLGSKIIVDGDCSHEVKRRLVLGRKAMTNLDSILKSKDTILPTKVHIVKVMVFPVVRYGCESWTIKKAECQRINAFEMWCWRTVENPLGCKEIKPVNPKGNQPWILIGRTDARAEAPLLWPPDAKSWLIGKNPDAGKDGRQKKE